MTAGSPWRRVTVRELRAHLRAGRGAGGWSPRVTVVLRLWDVRDVPGAHTATVAVSRSVFLRSLAGVPGEVAISAVLYDDGRTLVAADVDRP